jgi:hypothetical protein
MLAIYVVKPTNGTNPWHEPEMNSLPTSLLPYYRPAQVIGDVAG